MATQYGSYPAWHRSNRVQDWAILVLAVWLFISPWVLQFGGSLAAAGAAKGPLVEVSRAAWNAWVLGVISFWSRCRPLGAWRPGRDTST
jgi:SPW repeat-containing protein